MSTLREAFVKELADLYDAEKQIIKALPKMAKAAEHDELKQGFEQHLEETRNHISRVERVFTMIGAEAKTSDNDVFDELAACVKDSISDIDEGPVRDAALIADGNKVEHYEMAVYGTLVSYARQLELKQAGQILQETLAEEKAADAKLTEIGETLVNPSASHERRAA